MTREKMQLVGSVRFEEFLGTSPAHDFDVVPVIAARAAQIALGNAKARRLHYMQPRADACARARDIARVLRNFGFNENDIQHSYACSCCLRISSSSSSLSKNHSSSAAAIRALSLPCSAMASELSASLI